MGEALQAGRARVWFPGFFIDFGLGVDSACNRHEYLGYLQGSKGGRCVGPPLHADCLEILGASTSCSSKGLSGLVKGLLFIVHMHDELLQKLGSVIQTHNNAHTQQQHRYLTTLLFLFNVGGKGKAVPLQAWSGPEGSRKLRFPDFMTTAQDGGKVVSLTHRPSLPPRNTPGTHFC